MEKHKEELVTNNMGISGYVVNQFKGYGIDMDDLVSDAYFGLCKAADSYDPQKGIKFFTYATTVMKNEILMRMRKERKRKEVSLYSEIKEGEDLCLMDCVAPVNDFSDSIIDKECLASIIKNSKLSGIEKRIIFKYFFLQKNQCEISREEMLSQSYVSRIYKKALGKLRAEIEHVA